MSDDVPAGYEPLDVSSPFPDHVGRLFKRTAQGEDEAPDNWLALRVEDRHVNAWGLAHGGLIAFMAEAGTALAAWDPAGPAVVTVSLTTNFIRAPKLGQLLEVRARATRRTRSLVFVDAQAFADGELQFTATAVHKVVGG